MTNLAYDIVRSPKRRKLTITVERDCAVIVRAPANISDGEVARVVDSKRQWILEKLRHPQKYRNRQHPPGKEVVNGESALKMIGVHQRFAKDHLVIMIEWTLNQCPANEMATLYKSPCQYFQSTQYLNKTKSGNRC